MLYKSKILTLVTIEYICCIMMSIVIGPKWPFYSCCNYIGLLGTGFMQVFYLGKSSPYKGDSTRFYEVASGNPTSTCIPRVDG